jgi:hypothetical protein
MALLDDYENGESRTMGVPPTPGSRRTTPEGVAWEYEVEGGQAAGSVWLYSPNPESRAIGDPDWVKLFASKERAKKWLEGSEPKRDVWQYPVQE